MVFYHWNYVALCICCCYFGGYRGEVDGNLIAFWCSFFLSNHLFTLSQVSHQEAQPQQHHQCTIM